jgi:endo-1,4-beta-xylanase
MKTISCRSIIMSMLLIGVTGLIPMRTVSQQLTSNKDKFLGCGTSVYFYRYLDNIWNEVTPGNDGKWGSVENPKGTYNWTNLDKIYNFAEAKGLLYKHHNLVWGSQQPGWLSSLDSATQRDAVEKWIAAVGARYPKMDMVDVVNEPFHTPLPVYKNALGGDGATGWDWVITAFQLARKYCPPSAKLLLNEYNVFQDNTVTSNYIALINLLKTRGLIDGIGVQGHYFEFRSPVAGPGNYVYDLTTIKNNLNRLTALGLPVYITEFDIDEPVDSIQAAQYKIYFPIFWSNPGVKGITFWGYIQGDVWTAHPNTYLLLADGTERPAMQWLRSYVASNPVSVQPEEQQSIPSEFRLTQNYPNPFNPSTVIRYALPVDADVTLEVFNTLGQTVATPVKKVQAAGSYEIQFSNPGLPSGAYFYRIRAVALHGGKSFMETKKLVIQK